MVIVPLELGILLRAHLLECPIPKVPAMGQHVPFVDQRDRFFCVLLTRGVPLFLELESILEAAVHGPAVVDHELRCDLLGGPDAGRSPVSGVDAAGVLADNHKINMLRPLVPQGRLHVRIELDRSEIDILIERKADLEQNACFQDPRLDVRVADGAQEH